MSKSKKMIAISPVQEFDESIEWSKKFKDYYDMDFAVTKEPYPCTNFMLIDIDTAYHEKRTILYRTDEG